MSLLAIERELKNADSVTTEQLHEHFDKIKAWYHFVFTFLAIWFVAYAIHIIIQNFAWWKIPLLICSMVVVYYSLLIGTEMLAVYIFISRRI